MKKFSLFALAAAGLLLGACSSDDSIDSKVNGGDFTDGAFIGVSLQLPSTATATRANEDFDDGEEDEFAVKNATLYLFKGATEAAATYMAEYSIGTNFEKDGTTTDNITSTYCEATLISNEVADKIKNATDNVYAYVIVNHNGVIPAMEDGITFADFSKKEFSVIGSPVAAEKNIGEGGLLMTSSPISAAEGGSKAAPTTADNYTTLVKIDKTKIFTTAAAAKAAPAACIYVERAAVKITVSVSANIDKADNIAPATFDGWQIINYEPTYYNTRQVEPAWGAYASDATAADFALWKPANAYRFVSGVAFAPQLPSATGHTTGYRTYFAKDVQYDKDATLMKTVAGDTWIAMGKHGYTTENTFDVPRMEWENTTQVVLRAKFQEGTDFFTFNGGNDMYAEAAIETELATNIFNVPAVTNAINNALDALIAADPDHGRFKGEIVADVPTPTTATEASDNYTYTATYKFTKLADNTDVTSSVTGTVKTDLETQIANAIKKFTVAYFKGGYSYYNVRIKHFGDYETPWSSTKPFQTIVPGTTIPQIYGTDENLELATKRFLGRFGVVRDNWYKLEVSAVKHIGTATPVDVEKNGTPDDEIENYISVHVHILPWVLRNQDVVL